MSQFGVGSEGGGEHGGRTPRWWKQSFFLSQVCNTGLKTSTTQSSNLHSPLNRLAMTKGPLDFHYSAATATQNFESRGAQLSWTAESMHFIKSPLQPKPRASILRPILVTQLRILKGSLKQIRLGAKSNASLDGGRGGLGSEISAVSPHMERRWSWNIQG